MTTQPLSQALPERANLAHLRQRAKDLLRAARTADPAAVREREALQAASSKPR